MCIINEHNAKHSCTCVVAAVTVSKPEIYLQQVFLWNIKL